MKVRTEVYDTYWKTAFERQEIFFKKLKNEYPYTNDPIFQTYKFCNVYRASDRVSQFLIQSVIYRGAYCEADTLFRIFLFRLLNNAETWVSLENILGEIKLSSFSFDQYSKALEEIKKTNGKIYGNAFILCANKVFGFHEKHNNHLKLLEYVFQKSADAKNLVDANSLKALFHVLRKLPLIGDFMAYQIAIDMNYSEVFDFGENDFTIAGPGAIRGIKKCFIDTNGRSSEYIIQHMVEKQNYEFERLGLKFKTLWGRQMHAIDCQGWFCETDKYCRVKFPELKSNRVQMKSKFQESTSKIDYFYPPKWGIKIDI